MGGKIRVADRKTGPGCAPATRRQMAPGRGGDHDQRRAALAVARHGKNGEVLDILVQTRRNAQAAKRFISRLIARWGEPRVIVTDKLRSYGAAPRKLGTNVDQRAHKGPTNRIEGSHRPTRKREKIQGRFKSARQAQRLLSAHDETANLFRPRRHKMTASAYRQNLATALERWNDCANSMAA